MSQQAPPPSGWYEDPDDAAKERYWTGDTWGPSRSKPAAPSGWYPDPDPDDADEWAYWSGTDWSQRHTPPIPTTKVNAASAPTSEVQSTSPSGVTVTRLGTGRAKEGWSRGRIIAVLVLGGLVLVVVSLVVISETNIDPGCASDASDLYHGGRNPNSNLHDEWTAYARDCTEMLDGNRR